MTKIKYETILIAFLTLVIVFSFYIILQNIHNEAYSLVVKYEIGDKIGFNVDPNEINFGRLLPGSKGTRSIIISNEYNNPIKIKFLPSENIKEYISHQYGWISIGKNHTVNATFTLTAPLDKPEGNYSGFIEVRIIK